MSNVYKFELTEEQTKKANEWIDKQIEKDPKYDIIGYRFTFCFTNTTLGTEIDVLDRRTKERLGLTDDDNW